MKFGTVKVAYARVMLIGAGGVGKSSLLKGLRNEKFCEKTESTQGADTNTFRLTESYWARSTGGGHWVMVTDEDEIKELAQLLRRVRQDKQYDICPSEQSLSKLERDEFNHPDVKVIFDEIENASSKLEGPHTSTPDTEVYLRVWDCGGQPVFLNLLSAFLTARTLFLLMFDASLDLQSPCLHLTRHGGVVSKQFDNMTTLQLLMQWMATIHATLFQKGAVCSGEGKLFPRILPVGTHGDDAYVQANKDSILKTLAAAYSNKAFTNHLVDGVVVDNTTAGTEESEDPAFQVIRDIADKFARKDLVIDTPITWVLFRKVFERYSRGKPVVSLSEVKELAQNCFIREESQLRSVLAFYHDLSVFFHYTTVSSLASKVIVDPQWLIKQMAKILALEGFEEVRNEHLWNLLREKGILRESLYSQVLRNQSELKPQDIINLLEHFQVIAAIDTVNKHKFSGREYFVPSMLPYSKNRTPRPAIEVIQSAAPLHLIFSPNYLPPGFFSRLVTVSSRHKNFTVDFKEKLYSNEITFCYGHYKQGVDSVTATEEESSICIQVHRILQRPRKYPLFSDVCEELLVILQKAFETIKEEWFPGVDVNFAFECKACEEKGHFIQFESTLDYFTSSLPCQKGVPSVLTAEQKCWLQIDKVSRKVCFCFIKA
jgi:GTPase SAR1 family protein